MADQLTLRMAARQFSERHPGKKINITQALKEYSLSLGLPPSSLMVKGVASYADWIQTELEKIPCPSCGAELVFEIVPYSQSSVITGIIYCSSEYCKYHFYTLERLSLIHKLLVMNRFSAIAKHGGFYA